MICRHLLAYQTKILPKAVIATCIIAGREHFTLYEGADGLFFIRKTKKTTINQT